mmetsp:Transcript_23660/g.67324  ORF Transcript_23660/g.67324 Transcript_23660/m.67324 type:complete len:213 (+) Transcript_23660:808-1446(+)
MPVLPGGVGEDHDRERHPRSREDGTRRSRRRGKDRHIPGRRRRDGEQALRLLARHAANGRAGVREEEPSRQHHGLRGCGQAHMPARQVSQRLLFGGLLSAPDLEDLLGHRFGSACGGPQRHGHVGRQAGEGHRHLRRIHRVPHPLGPEQTHACRVQWLQHGRDAHILAGEPGKGMVALLLDEALRLRAGLLALHALGKVVRQVHHLRAPVAA